MVDLSTVNEYLCSLGVFAVKNFYILGMRFLLLLAVVASSSCAITSNNKYAEVSADDLLLLSHNTPSGAEKIQIRAYLAKHYPKTVGGLYAKAYLASKNGQDNLELKYLSELVAKFPNNPNTLHYQSFMGDFNSKIMAVKRGIEVAPSFLNYNFFIKFVDLYKEKKGKFQYKEILKAIDKYAAVIGNDIYVFDYARASIYKKMKGYKQKVDKYSNSALLKRGGILRSDLWLHSIDTRYPDGIVGKRHSGDRAYGLAIFTAIDDIKASAAAPRNKQLKDIVIHKLIKDLAYKSKKAGYKSVYQLYEKANQYYFTSEVVDDIRQELVKNYSSRNLLQVLEAAEKKLPNNPDVLGSLAQEYAYLKDYDKAESIYLRAINNSHVYIDKRIYTVEYSQEVLYPTFRAKKAISLLKDIQKKYKKNERGLFIALAKANLYDGNYDKSAGYLKKYKSSMKNSDSWFPEKLESIVNDYIERKNNTNKISKNKRNSAKVVATTSVSSHWLVVHPEQKTFIATNGDAIYNHWDANNLSIIDQFKNAIFDKDYTKSMTKPVFSPDGRYVAYATELKDDLGSVMLIYDLKNHRFSSQLPMIKKTSGLAWGPNGNEIAIWNYGRLIKYNVEKNAVVKQGEVKGQDGADIMFWTANGEYLALLERSAGGSIRIFDAETLEQTHRLTEVSWPHALGVSTNGKYIFSADNRSILHRWDTENNFKHKSIKIPVLGRLIAAHPSKPQIIINDWRGRNNLILVDYEKMKIITEVYTGKNELRIQYINNGERIIANDITGNLYEFYDSQSLERVKRYSGESAVVTGGAYADTKRNQLITWDQEGLHVWSIINGEKIRSWKGRFQSVISDLKNSNNIYALIKNNKAERTYIVQYNIKDGTEKEIADPNFIIDKWSINKNSILLAGRAFTSMNKGNFFGVVMVVDLKTNSYYELEVDMVTDILKYKNLTDSWFNSFAISPDRKRIALSTAWVDGWKQDETLSELTRVFDVETGKKEIYFEQVGELSFKDNENVIITDKKSNKSTVYSIKTGRSAAALSSKNPSNIGSHTKWGNNALFPNKKLLVKVSKDNKILFINNKSKNLILTLLAKRNDEWIAYLPTGEFSSSAHGIDKVYWEVNGEKLTAKEAVKKYKRRDVIVNTLRRNALK